ncbi:MAG: ribose 5-phosphate isomerase B [Saprospiraceae bacterium]
MNQLIQIAIGSDHAGFEVKESIKRHLKKLGYRDVSDLGTYSLASVDYPDFAHKVAETVETSSEPILGIVLCGSANGVCITVNKHEKIRAALCWDIEIASLARQHNDANIVCIPARFVSKRKANAIVDAFLGASFEGGRHQTRVNKIPISHK